MVFVLPCFVCPVLEFRAVNTTNFIIRDMILKIQELNVT